MTQELWTSVEGYIRDLFTPPDRALDGALEASRAAGLPAIAVAPNEGKLLFLLARLLRARRILEIGTLGGYSTIWLARGVEADGCVVTLELSPEHAAVAVSNLERAGVAGRVDVRVGRAAESLAHLAAEGGPAFDMVFIDADKAGYPEYFRRALELSRAGTLIVADNVVRDGAVIDRENTSPDIEGIRRFNELVANEPRVIATAVQTVGSKGYDGFAIALVV